MMPLPICHTAAMMLRGWIGPEKTELEPYEAGWAREAIAFIHIHDGKGGSAAPLVVELETSADGIRWAALAPVCELPPSGTHRIRGEGFGNWLRASLLCRGEVCADFYWVLK